MQLRSMTELGALVRSARTARGMTQADLATRVGVSRDWVVRLERGHPRLEAQRVIDALRVAGVDLQATIADPMTETPADPFDALFGTSSTSPLSHTPSPDVEKGAGRS